MSIPALRCADMRADMRADTAPTPRRHTALTGAPTCADIAPTPRRHPTRAHTRGMKIIDIYPPPSTLSSVQKRTLRFYKSEGAG